MGIKHYAVPFFLFLILPGLLYAQSQGKPDESILLSVAEEDDMATGMLGDVIVDSMALEFLLSDFRVRVSEHSLGEDLPDGESLRDSLLVKLRNPPPLEVVMS